MRLCMFHPNGHPLERGWVGRIDDGQVIHLAAQTLQSFLLGGGAAREHAVYPLDDVTLLAPVLHPPAVRVFDGERAFAFANPAAILPPGSTATRPDGADSLEALVRPCAVVGAEGAVGGWTILGELRAPGLEPPKDRDFALFLGPWVATEEEDYVARSRKGPSPFRWGDAFAYAGENTALRPGDLVAAPPVRRAELDTGPFELAVDGLGVLHGRVR